MKKTYFSIFLFSIISLIVAFNHSNWDNKDVINFDVSGYYLYLPATFIYKDLGELKFYDKIDSAYTLSKGVSQYALIKQKATGKKLNKYAIGVSLGELPLFFVADFYCKYLQNKHSRDGYTKPYHLSVEISSILWSIIGLLFLAKFLIKFFDESGVAITILCIGFGTNFYCYNTYLLGMSHTLLFMLFSGILYFTERWHSTLKLKYAILLGSFLGWTIISRPVDFTIILVVLFWPLSNSLKNQFKNRLVFWFNYRTHLLISFAFFMLFAAIQICYWKYVTGDFIHYSYEGEKFDFLNPHVIDGLFSYRKGWFVYSPIALIGIIGLIPLLKYNANLAKPITIFFVVFTYFVFSWSCWWYGWGFGARGMIESYAVLSISLAALINFCIKASWPLKSLAIATFLFFIWLNLYQTEQYNIGAIPGDNVNRQFYWRVWNKMHPSEEDWKYYSN